MKRNRTKNSVRNSFYGILNRFTNLLIPFFIRTIILQKLGYEYLGLGSLFTSVIQVLNLSELGIGSALVFRMYKPVEKGDYEELNSLLSLYKRIYRFIGFLVFGLGLLLLPFLPKIVHAENLIGTGVKLYPLFLIYLANTVLSYLFFAYKKSILIAYQRNDIISSIDCIVHTVMYICQIVLLYVIPNYYLYICLLPIFTLIDNFTASYIVSKKYPQIQNCSTKKKLSFSLIFNDVKYIIGHKIGGVIISSSDSIVISAFLNLLILTKYANYHYIITALMGFLNVGYNAVLSSVGNSVITESKEKILSLFYDLSYCTFFFVSFCSCCLLSLFQPFMQIWMGESYMFDFLTIILFVVYFYTWQIRIMGLNFKDAAGMWKNDFYKPYVGMLVNIFLNVCLVKSFGVNGVLLATIIVMFFIYFPWETIVLFRDLFKTNMKNYLVKEFFYICVTIVVAYLVYIINNKLVISNSLGGLVIRFIVTIIISLFLIIISTFWMKEFKNILKRIKSLFNKI